MKRGSLFCCRLCFSYLVMMTICYCATTHASTYFFFSHVSLSEEGRKSIFPSFLSSERVSPSLFALFFFLFFFFSSTLHFTPPPLPPPPPAPLSLSLFSPSIFLSHLPPFPLPPLTTFTAIHFHLILLSLILIPIPSYHTSSSVFLSFPQQHKVYHPPRPFNTQPPG